MPLREKRYSVSYDTSSRQTRRTLGPSRAGARAPILSERGRFQSSSASLLRLRPLRHRPDRPQLILRHLQRPRRQRRVRLFELPQRRTVDYSTCPCTLQSALSYTKICMGWWGRTRYPSARGVPLSRALTSNKLRLQRSVDLLSMARRLSAFFSKSCACANRIQRSISARSSNIRACTRGMNGVDWSHAFRNGRTDNGSGQDNMHRISGSMEM
jgi:hypothetical protein